MHFFLHTNLDDEKCKGVENFGSYMCFTFEIPADIDYNDVDAAELWVYRQPDPNANEAQSFLVSEIESWDSKKINKPFAIHYANSSGMYSHLITCTQKCQFYFDRQKQINDLDHYNFRIF